MHVEDAVDAAHRVDHVAEEPGSPISKTNRLIATRSRVVFTEAERMFTWFSERTRVTSESSDLRSSASIWISTR